MGAFNVMLDDRWSTQLKPGRILRIRLPTHGDLMMVEVIASSFLLAPIRLPDRKSLYYPGGKGDWQ